MKTPSEIRLDKEGKLDDIIINCSQVHLEKLDDNVWWIGCYKNHKRIAFHIINSDMFVLDNELNIPITKL